MMTRPLGGVTLPSDFSIAMMDWRRERDQRKAAIKDAGGPIDALEAGLPDPRGWWSYAIDPRGDGAPTSPQSNHPAKLDPSSPLNTDSLVLQPWWDSSQPGRNEKQILQYMQMMRSEIDDWQDISGIMDYGLEAFSPDIYIPTSMADYVPNIFNIFTDEHGNRDDPTNYGGFWQRTGVTAGQGVVGLGLAAGTGFIFLMFAPKVTERTLEIAEQGIVGTLEIAEKVVQKTTEIFNPFSAKRRMNRLQTKKLMGTD
jgi:hypothetical protein